MGSGAECLEGGDLDFDLDFASEQKKLAIDICEICFYFKSLLIRSLLERVSRFSA